MAQRVWNAHRDPFAINYVLPWTLEASWSSGALARDAAFLSRKSLLAVGLPRSDALACSLLALHTRGIPSHTVQSRTRGNSLEYHNMCGSEAALHNQCRA
jgi:hypothetical protein